MTIVCPQCQHKNPDDTEFCENCGAQLPVPSPVGAAAVAAPSGGPAPLSAPDSKVCPNCKAPYAEGDVFCFNCGNDLTKLGEAQATTVAAPVSTGNGAATPVPATSTPAAAPAQPAQDQGMSETDWDKAFAAPAQASAPVAVTPSPAAPAEEEAAVAVSPAPAADNAFGAPAPADNAFGAPAAATAAPAAPVAPAPAGVMRLHVAGPYGDEVVEYKGKELLLGRQDVKTRVFPDLNLDDSAASRRHLSIWKEDSDGQFYAQDLESSNGSTLNGRDMEPGAPTQLHNGDVIKIGTRYSIQVRIS